MKQPIRHGIYRRPPLTDQKEQKKYSVIRILIIILLVTNLVSFMVWQNIKGLKLDKRLGQLERTQLELHNVFQDKLLEYEKLRSSKKIKQFAKEKLNMINTSRKDFIMLGIQNKKVLIEKFLSGKKELEY